MRAKPEVFLNLAVAVLFFSEVSFIEGKPSDVGQKDSFQRRTYYQVSTESIEDIKSAAGLSKIYHEKPWLNDDHDEHMLVGNTPLIQKNSQENNPPWEAEIDDHGQEFSDHTTHSASSARCSSKTVNDLNLGKRSEVNRKKRD